MNPSSRFRQAFAVRILKIAALASLASPLSAGCGGRVIVEPGSGGAGGGFSNPTDTSSDSSASGSSDYPACFAWPTDQACPSQMDAYMHLGLCQEILDEGTRMGEDCCYPVDTSNCGVVGRPFLVGDRPLTASAHRGEPGHGWSRGAAFRCPDLTALSPADRAALAAGWTQDALLEHASIASFARFSLDLMAVGAPAELIAAAHAAAIDEVNHARLCFALASAYGDAPVEPRPFPFGGAVAVSADLEALATAAAREGCIGETLAALLALEQLERATDPAVRAVLATIAEDEARHAELAWRTVAWALATGDAAVRSAVAAVFAAAERELPAEEAEEPWSDARLAHGRLGAASTRAALKRALDEVVRPSAEALLARPSRPSLSARDAEARSPSALPGGLA